ncbi:MAG: glycosyltransferase [Candidatus Aenigmarchaeota archaeon]|nr:glycosyltransferase [Candidatus Aenigmarchaeota archaeon]
MATKDLSVIIPAYNEEKNIYKSLSETLKSLDSLGLDFEIILVSDGSKDSTVEEAKKVKDLRIKIYHYNRNRGKGFALKYGFKKSSGEKIIFLDGDSQIPSSQLSLYLSYMNSTDADIVIGSKRHPQSVVNYPTKRVLLSYGYQLLNKLLFNLNVTDTQVGLKLFKREVLEHILPKVLVKKYAFDLELLVNANYYGYKIQEAPVLINFSLDSKINKRQILRMFIDTMAIFYRLRVLNYYQRQ